MITSWRTRLVTAAVVAPALYWSVTQSMILYSARYVSTSHSCLVLWRFDHVGFLTSMGPRAIPALKTRIDDPSLGLIHKIHPAWVLGRLGDTSRFSVFLRGLASSSEEHQFMSVIQMRDFPEQYRRWAPAILSQARQTQHAQYWSLLQALAEQSRLPPRRIKALDEALAEYQVANKPLSPRQIISLQRLFRP